ncbi:MAG: hypothetical protein J7496_15550 [Novosphingobium sp.]|nr:hypothetical protein [Novosphingobium sp.]MBO9603916.1 hypothetical protein [Novosphingobium sp.]
MNQNTPNAGADAQRAAVADRVRRYPDLTPQELDETLLYLRKQATILDRAAIAADPEVEPQYRKLCHDHYLSRPRPLAVWLGAAAAALIAATALAAFAPFA